MLDKKSREPETPEMDSLIQLQNGHKDDFDMAAVDDIMKKYDLQEKNQKQNEDFVQVLKKDEKLLNFFIENYQPGTNQIDDEKYVSYEFSKFSEQGWSDDGKQLDKQVLSKKKARKFVEDIVKKWKGYDLVETDQKQLAAQVDKFIGSKFERAWKKFDQTKTQSGMIDMVEAHNFLKEIIPQADPQAVSQAQTEDIMNELDKSGSLI